MLPTKYRGVATIDGEKIPAELQLDADHLRLALEQGEELIRWPLAYLDIEPKRKGGYELKRGNESFGFEPSVDDGLGDEISLRRRFSPERPAPQKEPRRPTVADRVRAAGRGVHRRPALLEGRDLDMGTAGMVLGVLAIVVLIVAAVSGAFSTGPATVVVGDVGVTPSLNTAPAPTEAPAPTVPPTVAAATVTSAPAPTTTVAAPSTTVAPTTTAAPPTTTPSTTAPSIVGPPPSAFELTPDEAVAQWDALARPLSPALAATDVSVSADEFRFNSGGFVVVEGVATDGVVSQVTLRGDPSGTVSDDREVLTALGLTVALVEPSLPPEGRRQLLSGLGLDIDDPELDGLNGAFDYQGKAYSLRWDEESGRLIFQIGPAPDDGE